ncbi:hypothetical protein BD770DRAFT_377329 [Pilaira anomala]|nr:hypothetical protein BD770DRAFT_377329 [Pilaira anomala]
MNTLLFIVLSLYTWTYIPVLIETPQQTKTSKPRKRLKVYSNDDKLNWSLTMGPGYHIKLSERPKTLK